MPSLRTFKMMTVQEEELSSENANFKDYKNYLTYSKLVLPLLIIGIIAFILSQTLRTLYNIHLVNWASNTLTAKESTISDFK